ncbi:MAG: TolC family protein [Cytophagaceae bacterium]
MRAIIVGLLLLSMGISSQADTLTIRQAVAIALERNFSILMAKNEQEIAAVQNTIGNAGMLPRVDVNGSSTNNINNTRLELLTGDVRTANSAKSSNLSGNVMLNWTIFDGFKMFATKDYLELTESLSTYETRSMIESTVASVINTYTLLLLRQQYYQTLQEAYQLSKQRKEIYDQRIKIGTASRLQYLQAEIDMNEDSVQMILQQKYIQEAKMMLNYLLARYPEQAIDVQDSITINNSIQWTGLEDKMKEQNTSLLVARANAEAVDKNFQIIRSKRYPTLNLFGGYNYSLSQTQLGVVSLNRAYGPTFGATVSMNLYNGSKTSTEMQQARLRQDNATLQVESKNIEVQKQLMQAYLNYEYQLKIFNVESYNMKLAEENLSIAYEQYKTGVLNDLLLRDIQFKTLNAQSKYYEAYMTIKQSETELLRLTGELFQEYNK